MEAERYSTMKSRYFFCAIMIIGVNAMAPARGAFFEGAMVSARIRHRTTLTSEDVVVQSSPTLVGQGVEFEGFASATYPESFEGLVDIDVSDTSILITLIRDQPTNAAENVGILDSTMTVPRIRKVFVDPSSNWEGFVPSLATAGPDTVFVNVSTMSGKAGQFILLHVTPEPGTSVLAVAGCAMWLARRRK